MQRPGDNLETWNGPCGRREPDSDNSWYLSPPGNKLLFPTSVNVPSKRLYDEVETDKQEAEVDGTIALSAKEEKKRIRLEARIAKEKQRLSSDLQTANDTSKGNDDLKMLDKNLQQVVSSISDPQNETGTEAALCSGLTGYTRLGNIRFGETTSLIGVVTSFSQPSRTYTGDLMCWVQVVDSSIYDMRPLGIKINCFSKRYKEWLPAAEYGDILILSDVKITRYNNSLVGTGYYDKLRWAACSALGQIHHGPPNTAPQSEVLAEDKVGVPFCPFYKPNKEEILYCVKVSDWWRDMQKPTLCKEPSPPNQKTRVSSNTRVHRLISEAGPDVPPQGYFNCTVEILQGYQSSFRDIYSVYVTDYTRNERTAPVEYKWCPPALSNYVLLIEMWDAASQMGPSMRPGEFYQIDNVRMKANNKTSFLEAKIQQKKIFHLEPRAASLNSHLKGLLERKHKWEEEQCRTEPEISYRLFQDFQKDKIFHCAVEVLQTMTDKPGKPCLYVTDYTSHPNMKSLIVNEPWAQRLNGYIIKIFLEGEQQRMAESITAVEDCLCGHLGGGEKLITMANPNRTDNEHLNGLLRRKDIWGSQVGRKYTQPVVVEERPQVPTHPDSGNSRKKEKVYNFLRFQDIPSATAGALRLNINAKPVSFHPLDLDDAVYQFCSRCQVEIPLKQRACCKCGDFEHECVEYKYQLFMFVEDQEKKQILVSVNDTSPIWNGLKRVPLRENSSTRESFRARLEPLLGNLPLVHEAYIAGKSLEKETSFHVLELDSWITADMERGYVLRSYD